VPKGDVKPRQVADLRQPPGISGRIPVLVAGPARALTQPGEPVRRTCRGR